MKDLLNTGEVSDLLGIPYYKISYLINARKIPRPEKRNNRYVFDEQLVEKIKLLILTDLKKKDHRD